MGVAAVNGCTVSCIFGSAPGQLVAAQATCLGNGIPMATIKDVTIPPLGLCSSLANPAVASATTAALGVLTPQPCTCVPAGTWTPGKPSVMVGGVPALSTDSKLMCGLGMGQISINAPGQTKCIIG